MQVYGAFTSDKSTIVRSCQFPHFPIDTMIFS